MNNKNPKGHFADTPLHFAAERGHIGRYIDLRYTGLNIEYTLV